MKVILLFSKVKLIETERQTFKTAKLNRFKDFSLQSMKGNT